MINIKGIAVPMYQDNIDSDQIIPSVEMRLPTKRGLSGGLFANARYQRPIKGRIPNKNFVLNQPKFKGASILVSKNNFGCGSSREHAVWSLKEYGFKAIVALSFGRIFYGNCLNNLIAPLKISVQSLEKLMPNIDDGQCELNICLVNRTISTRDITVDFIMENLDLELIVNQTDVISSIESNFGKQIDAFSKKISLEISEWRSGRDSNPRPPA